MTLAELGSRLEPGVFSREERLEKIQRLVILTIQNPQTATMWCNLMPY